MTEEDEEFLDVVRRKLAQVENRIAEMPTLQQKRYALQLTLKAYGWPMLPFDPIVSAVSTIVEEQARPAEEQRRSNVPGALERPDGIPSNIEMIRIVLTDADRSLTGAEIRDAVQRKYWPDVPSEWKSTPFGFLSSGKLVKDDDNKFRLPVAPQRPPAPPVRKVVNEGAKLGPPVRTTGEKFEYQGKTVILHYKEFRIVQRLKPIINAGFFPFATLVDSAFEGERRGSIEPQAWMRDMVDVLNPKLLDMGLELRLVPKLGYSLRTLD